MRSAPRDATRAMLWLIALTALLRLALAGLLGLSVDESYSVAISRQLALSYFDHPPLHVWLVGLWARLLGSEQPLLLRLPDIVMFAASTWLMYRLTASRVGGTRRPVGGAGAESCAALHAQCGRRHPPGWAARALRPSRRAVFHRRDTRPAELSACARVVARGGRSRGPGAALEVHGDISSRSPSGCTCSAAGACCSPPRGRGSPHSSPSCSSRRYCCGTTRTTGPRSRSREVAPYPWACSLAGAALEVAGQLLYLLPWIALALVYALARALRRGPHDEAAGARGGRGVAGAARTQRG